MDYVARKSNPRVHLLAPTVLQVSAGHCQCQSQQDGHHLCPRDSQPSTRITTVRSYKSQDEGTTHDLKDGVGLKGI